MNCPICLSKLKEPVSLPCGHVQCSDCLTNHILATSAEAFTSTCPSCREPFNLLRPELTAIPKKLHPYILPSIRRVYLDPSASNASLRKKLAAADARIRSLEADKDRLLAEGERQMAAARAHRDGETRAVLAVRAREEELEHAKIEGGESEAALKALRAKYDKLKRHCRALEKDGNATENSTTITALLPLNAGKRNTSVVDLDVGEASTPKRLRIMRPLPNRGRLSLQTLTKSGLPLGSPFHTLKESSRFD